MRALSIDVVLAQRLDWSAVTKLADTRGEGDTGYASSRRASARLTVVVEEQAKHRQCNANRKIRSCGTRE